MSVRSFLEKHDAYQGVLDWAVENCQTMEEVWRDAKPEWLVWLATRPGALSDRELHEFSWWAASQVRHLMKDQRTLGALNAKRRWLDGLATGEELDSARDAARAAAWAAADAAGAAAWDAAWDAQAAYLRANCHPCFKEV